MITTKSSTFWLHTFYEMEIPFDCIYLDFAKAFDRVSHQRLLTSVVSGIPQGSVLGPSLFTIFINDIPNDITSKVRIFADDTKLYNSAHLNHLIQEDLNHLLQWSDKWLLPFNIEKCPVLPYGKVNPKNDYMMNDISVLLTPVLRIWV